MVCEREFVPLNETAIPVEVRSLHWQSEFNKTKSRLDHEGNYISHVKVLTDNERHPKHIQHTGMCFMLKNCIQNRHLTCHRFKAVYKAHRGIIPEKVYRQRSYYQYPSSCEVMQIEGSMTPIRWCSR